MGCAPAAGTLRQCHRYHRLEEWPALFTEDCVYEIVPKENVDRGVPMGIMHYFGRSLMRDRVISLRKANVFEPHTYRHMTSGLEFTQIEMPTIDMQSNYLLVQTLSVGGSRVFQAGPYFERVVRTANGWRYQRKRVVYDTSRIQTLLVTPVGGRAGSQIRPSVFQEIFPDRIEV